MFIREIPTGSFGKSPIVEDELTGYSGIDKLK
jgi:hypothetical protein